MTIRSLSPRAQALILGMIAAALYLPSLSFDFVYDDLIHITQNAHLRSWSGIWASFTEPMFPGNLYRPVVESSYVLTAQFFGLIPLAFHAGNVLLHSAVCVLLLFFLRSFLSAPVAFASALLYAIHPIHVETVANVSGRPELFAALFGLGSLLLLIAYIKREKSLIPGALCALAAFLSKESAFVLLPLLPFVWLIQPTEISGGSIRRLSGALFSVTAVALLALALRYQALGGLFRTGAIDPVDNILATLPPFERIGNAFFLLGKYLGLLFLPLTQSADYSYAALSPLQNSELVSFVIIGISMLCFTALALAVDRKKLGFLLLWFFIAFSITANVFFPIGTIFGERLAYFPAIGVISSISLLLWRIPVAQLRFIATGFFALFFVSQALSYQSVWRNAETLFAHQLKVSPRSVKTQVNAAAVSRSKGEFSKAREQLQSALAIVPEYSDALYGLGLVSLLEGQGQDAARFFSRAVISNPKHVPTLVALAQMYVNARQFSRARLLLKHIFQLDNDNIKAHETFLALHIQQGNGEQVAQQQQRLRELGITSRTIRELSELWKEHQP